MKTIIRGGEVINPSGMQGKLDLLIEHGHIVHMAEQIDTPADEVVDATGRYVFPGLVDMHCHLREPGYEYKETIASGTRAAVAGGFTSVCCMPNTEPVVDDEAGVRYIRQRAQQAGYAKVYPIAAITKGLQGNELTEMGYLLAAGAVAFIDDGRPVESARVMRNAMLYAKNFDALLCSHCEELSLVNGGVMNEGEASTRVGLRGNTRAAEEVMLSREILLAESMDGRVHICHVSTRQGFEMVRQAKKRGVRVSCETCPHYFSLTDEACTTFDTNTKINPPLRTEDDRQAAIEALADGTCDVIATDHAPHHIDDKQVEFDLAANGASGFETALSLGYMHLVQTKRLSMTQLIDHMSTIPARIMGLDAGILQPGGPADVVVFDPSQTWTVEADKLYTKGKNTPWLGQTLQGKVTEVWVDGRPVLRHAALVE